MLGIPPWVLCWVYTTWYICPVHPPGYTSLHQLYMTHCCTVGRSRPYRANPRCYRSDTYWRAAYRSSTRFTVGGCWERGTLLRESLHSLGETGILLRRVSSLSFTRFTVGRWLVHPIFSLLIRNVWSGGHIPRVWASPSPPVSLLDVGKGQLFPFRSWGGLGLKHRGFGFILERKVVNSWSDSYSPLCSTPPIIRPESHLSDRNLRVSRVTKRCVSGRNDPLRPACVGKINSSQDGQKDLISGWKREITPERQELTGRTKP